MDKSGAGRPSLKVKLQTLTPVACMGSPLKLKLEVTNVGQEIVRLNRAYFWNNYSVHPSAPQAEDQAKEYFIAHVWPRSTSEDIIHLEPGKTYTSHRYWELDESISSPGRYTLEVGTYGTWNQVEFELNHCRQPEVKEHE
jgi:hypothetical protein